MKALTLTAVTENIPEVTAFIDAQLEALDCCAKARIQIDMAIDEVFSNIAYYAYAPGTGDVTVRFEFDASTGTAAVTFIDRGVPYNPLGKDDPDVTLSARERGIGGLGIFLVKKTMDDVKYRRGQDCNMLTIYKRIQPDRPCGG